MFRTIRLRRALGFFTVAPAFLVFGCNSPANQSTEITLSSLSTESIESGRQLLSGHLHRAFQDALPLGPVPGDDVIVLGIGLPLRNRDRLATFLHNLSDPSSSEYHKYVTPEQFAEAYGPTEADYLAVADFARSAGLQVVQTFGNRAFLRVAGAVSAIENVLHIRLNRYARRDGSPFRAPDREPSLNIDVPVLHISGLDDYEIPKPMAGGSGSGKFLGGDFRNAYFRGNSQCTQFTGLGQRVGLLELDAYNGSDVSQYATLAGMSSINVSPVGVSVDCGLLGCPSLGSTPGKRLEVQVDIEIAAAMAPAATIVPFIATVGTGADAPNAVLNAMATTTPLSYQLSSSWNTDSDDNTLNAMAQIAAQGQAFFQSSGDNGSYGSSPPVGLKWAVAWADMATFVGGTVLTMSGAGTTYVSETTWPSSGGGIFQYTGLASPPIPSYQQGFINSLNQGSSVWRNSPDVSAVAQDVLAVADGTPQPVSGTSIASPLWAGYTAVLNQRAGSNGLPPIGSMNVPLFAVADTGAYGVAFNDVRDSSNNGGYVAVSGYDLATGLGTPRCDLMYFLVGGASSPLPVGGEGSNHNGPEGATLDVSATETMSGPKLCAKGTHLDAGSPVRANYFGIPGRNAPMEGNSQNVQADGSFDLGVDTGTEFLVGSCNGAQLSNTVTVTISERDASSKVVKSISASVPAGYWCANASVATDYNGGCP